jgi:hypothetical protein
MIEKTIFYSWQSDLNHDFNWKLIEKSILDTIHSLNSENKLIKFTLDQATRGLSGSPDIVDSIFRKIEKSTIFVADISPIAKIADKGIPNPNVLIELGYAVNILGWDNIICICNKAYGQIEALPFDIKQRRVTSYSLDSNKQKEKQTQNLREIFKVAFLLIQENQANYDKVTELFKTQLDLILLAISNHFNAVFGITESIIGIDVFYDVMEKLESGHLKANAKIKVKETGKFLEDKIKQLSELTRHPLLILNKKIDQITTVIMLIKSLELLHSNIMSGRFYDLNVEKGKVVELNEVGILNMLLSEISKNIIRITDVWGEHLLIDPSRIEF